MVTRLIALARNATRQEYFTLLLLLLTAGAIWAFIELADEVIEGETRAIDEAILRALREPGDPSQPLGPIWLEEVFRDFTALGGAGVLMALTLAVAGFLGLQRKYRSMGILLVAVGSGLVLSLLLKIGFDRPRPELVPHGTYTFTASFPSGHSMMAAVVYLTLGALLARTQAQKRMKTYILSVAVLVTLLVGISRVYLGVHWPSDVLAGWTAGAAWALLWWAVARWLQRHRYVETATGEEE